MCDLEQMILYLIKDDVFVKFQFSFPFQPL